MLRGLGPSLYVRLTPLTDSRIAPTGNRVAIGSAVGRDARCEVCTRATRPQALENGHLTAVPSQHRYLPSLACLSRHQRNWIQIASRGSFATVVYKRWQTSVLGSPGLRLPIHLRPSLFLVLPTLYRFSHIARTCGCFPSDFSVFTEPPKPRRPPWCTFVRASSAAVCRSDSACSARVSSGSASEASWPSRRGSKSMHRVSVSDLFHLARPHPSRWANPARNEEAPVLTVWLSICSGRHARA